MSDRLPSFDPSRRRVLRGALAAGSLLLPWPRAWAQSEGAAKLLRAPKSALVIGNSRYRSVPALRNPVNDAKMIAGVLGTLGFEVTVKLDAARGEMLAAIQAYAQTLGAKQSVGLFYYAGHGLQLAWRNYLLPVDAAIGRIEDVPAEGVDLASLIEGIGRAANPMNVIVLDACRENPFGRDFREVRQGLSQMDAPQATLLAYATAPGHVASDGEGANGLYTGFLLKEMRVADSRIEDVFKRVRLEVRRETRGAQIPWESTSLEEDFYFLPPAELKELSDAERDREFRAQLALWESVKKSNEPGPLIEYLQRYPSSDYSELAQLRLDRVLARQGERPIEIASAVGNPFSKGSARADTRYRMGDSYTYRRIDLASGAVQGTFSTTITGISGSEVTYDRGLVTDLLGNTLRRRDGRVFTDNQNVPVEFEVGKKWTTRYRVDSPKGFSTFAEVDYQIVERAPLAVPAGTFNAFLVEGVGSSTVPKGVLEVRFKAWWDPQRARRPVAREEVRQLTFERRPRRANGRTRPRMPRAERSDKTKVLEAERFELVRFKQA